MTTFDICVHPSADVKAVKRGFSWPGFFFGAIWAFAKKLWLVGFLLIVAMTVLGILGTVAEANRSPGLMIVHRTLVTVLLLVVGFNGNK